MAAPSDADLRAAANSLAQRMLASDRTVVTAESCTGGWIGKVCTDLPGSSRWYLGGVVSYANEAKAGLLGVESALLQAHGAVSESVARAMAQGALEQLGGDLSVAVSGIAGPDGGTPDKPVGTVCFAWALKGARGRVETRRFRGDRDLVRRRCVAHALRGVLAMLAKPAR
jgi:nicotinamide-nucleotide amidase